MVEVDTGVVWPIEAHLQRLKICKVFNPAPADFRFLWLYISKRTMLFPIGEGTRAVPRMMSRL